LLQGQRGYEQWKEQYKALSREERIRYCIDQLRNERYHEFWNVGGLADKPYTSDPESSPRYELVKIGKDAIPALIAALERKEKTGIVPSRHSMSPWLVQDAALDVIQKIACREFSDAIHRMGPEKSFLAALSQDEHRKLVSDIRAWWKENRDADEVAWAEAALMSGREEEWWYRWWAARALYARIGTGSYPILVRAYERLPGSDDPHSLLTSQKESILSILRKEPSARERGFLLRALQDRPFSVRLKAAGCLWALDDRTGLERILREAEGLLSDRGGDWLKDCSDELMGFFSLCGTREAKEMVVKCLNAGNPYLRKSAVYEAPRLKMEKAVRKLPDLFDDPFVLGGSYRSTQGGRTVTVPPRQICDAAAKAFNKVVPDSPRFGGGTDQEQQESIRRILAWWKENEADLAWNASAGTLRLRRPSVPARPGTSR